VVAVQVVEHHHVERRGGRPALLEAADVQVRVVVTRVGQPVHQPREAVEREDHRGVGAEQGVVLQVGHPVRMVLLGQQPHEVDDVDDADRQVGQPVAQDADRGERLQGRDVTGAGEHHVGRVPVASLLAQSQIPAPRAQCSAACSASSQSACGCLPATPR
jgi:hypothetical protein